MIFRLVITTVEESRLEQPSREAAQQRAAELESEINRHHHHGERTSIVVADQLGPEEEVARP